MKNNKIKFLIEEHSKFTILLVIITEISDEKSNF